MRIRSVSFNGIGGLRDGRVDFPVVPVVALAGPNGTGKSKLLAAILSFWSGVMPFPADTVNATVRLEVSFSAAERIALDELSLQVGWGESTCPEEATLISRQHIGGFSRESSPPMSVISSFLAVPAFVQKHRSLDLVYLPAERRLLAPNNTSIELDQLTELVSFQKTAESRTSVQNYGRLDDQEFERFAAALSVASQLAPDPDGPLENTNSLPDPDDSVTSRIDWNQFSRTINDLIFPKKLLPLTQSHPSRLRIRVLSGECHYVPDLSSGERQALVIISRVLRAGAGDSSILIDEPDAYLHPQLSQRLIAALSLGIGSQGQLIVATHSPAILDALPTNAILRLSHDKPVAPVGSESDRMQMYQETGFRASAITQSDLLLVTEGDSDGILLQSLLPKLSKASIITGHGRAGVINRVKNLVSYDLPVIGTVDRDVSPPALDDPKVASQVIVWPTADVEGLFLSDDTALQVMIDNKLVKASHRDLDSLRALIASLYESQRDNVIAELAKNTLRNSEILKWPKSRGDDPLGRLQSFVSSVAPIEQSEVDSAVDQATKAWNDNAMTPWLLVRGKYIIGDLVSEATDMRTGAAFLEAVAVHEPKLKGIEAFSIRVDDYL